MIPALLVGFLFKRGSAATDSTKISSGPKQRQRPDGRDDHLDEAGKDRPEAGQGRRNAVRDQKAMWDEVGRPARTSCL